MSNLPIEQSEGERAVVDWIKSQYDGEWLPRYDAPAALLTALLLATTRNSDQVSSTDKALLSRLLEQFGMTPLSNAKLQRLIGDRNTSENEFAEFKEA